MKKIIKKSLGWFIILCFILSMFAVNIYATTRTQDEAVSWAKAQVGKTVGNGQCVALVKAYYEFLGEGTPYGNAKDYVNNVPTGWKRVDYHWGFSPVAGDVIVWSYSKWAEIDGVNYGHVGIVTYSNSSEIGVIDQNRKGYYVTEGTYPYESPNMTIACVLRPNFNDTPTQTSWNTEAKNISETSAVLTTTYNTSSTSTFLWKGCNVFYENGDMLKQLGENVSYSGNNCDIYYDLSANGITLTSGATYKYQFYLNVNGTDIFDEMRSFKTKEGNTDETAPNIYDVEITNVDSTGYTVNFSVSDEGGLGKVQIPTWTLANDQDDLVWHTYSEDLDTNYANISYRVKVSEHNYESGLYGSHIYVWDISGNQAVYKIKNTIDVPAKTKAETTTTEKITEKTTRETETEETTQRRTESTTYKRYNEDTTRKPKTESTTYVSPSKKIQLQINNPIMYVNGNKKNIDSNYTCPIILDNRTLLPVRAVVEEMNGTVDWDSSNKTVTLRRNGKTIKLVINSYISQLDGEMYELDTPPVIINGRTMLPIRFIAESFGFLVDWDGNEKVVTIS